MNQQLDKFDPDWLEAYSHGQACSVGVSTIQNNHLLLGLTQNCRCCRLPIRKNQISLSQNTKQLSFLGAGFPLYFDLIKYCLIMLFIQIVSYNIISLYWAYQHNYDFCINQLPKQFNGEEILCTSFSVQLSRIQTEFTEEEHILRVASFFIQIITLVYIRDKMIKSNELFDERNTSYADYSILIEHLPKKKGIKKNLHQFFSKFFSRKHQIYDVVLIGHFQQLYELIDKKQLKLKQKSQILKANQESKQEKLNAITSEIQFLENQIFQELKLQQTKYEQDQIICEQAIICIQTDQEKQQILLEFCQNASSDKISEYFEDFIFQKALNLTEALEPRQILWKNFNLSLSKRIKNRILGWILTILFLGIVTGIFFFLMDEVAVVLKSKLQNSKGSASIGDEQQLSAFLAFLSYISIILFNKLLMTLIIHHIIVFEKYASKNEEQFAFTLKYTLGLFFTTALMTLLVEDFSHHNIYIHEYGVIESETIMFFLTAFLVPCIWMINPWNILYLIKKKLYINTTYITQHQANALMEKVPYQMGKRYAEIIQVIWFSFLYFAIIPIGCVLSFLGLICYYWVDKYNLLRRSSVKEQISGNLSLKVLTLIDMSLFFRSIGQLIFDFQIKDTYSWTTILLISASILYILLPTNKILHILHSEQFKRQEKPYSIAKQQLGESYSSFHPILSFKDSIQNQIHSSHSQSYLSTKDQKFFNQVQMKRFQATLVLNFDPEAQLKIGQIQYKKSILKAFRSAAREKRQKDSIYQSEPILDQQIKNIYDRLLTK